MKFTGLLDKKISWVKICKDRISIKLKDGHVQNSSFRIFNGKSMIYMLDGGYELRIYHHKTDYSSGYLFLEHKSMEKVHKMQIAFEEKFEKWSLHENRKQ